MTTLGSAEGCTKEGRLAQREGNKHVHVCHHPAAFTTMPTPRSTGEVGPDRRAHHQFLRNLARVTPIPRTTKA